MLRRLDPGTMYEVMICRPGFNTSSIRPPPMPNRLTPFIADCGYCTACYSTEEIFYDFDTTTVSRIDATHVQLVCDITSNVAGFTSYWSISDPVNENERIMLDDGGVIDGLPVSIADERQGSGGFMSVLVAPEGVLDRDIQCIANSSFGRQSSESGAFQLIEGRPYNNIIASYNGFFCMYPWKPMNFIRHIYLLSSHFFCTQMSRNRRMISQCGRLS